MKSRAPPGSLRLTLRRAFFPGRISGKVGDFGSGSRPDGNDRDYGTAGERNSIDCRMPVTEVASPMVGGAHPCDGVRSGSLNNPIFRTYACT
jgi:hypothetical protein